MDAYVYQAALLYTPCAEKVMAKLGQDPKFGSDHYPKARTQTVAARLTALSTAITAGPSCGTR
jgi:hypothetical protein